MKPILVVYFASTFSYAGLLQADLIPPSIWSQYPLLLIFGLAVIAMARYYQQEQNEWRQMVKDEREQGQLNDQKWLELLKDERLNSYETLTKALKDQNESQVALLQMMQKANKEMFEALSRSQFDAFEQALENTFENISSQFYSLKKEINGGQN